MWRIALGLPKQPSVIFNTTSESSINRLNAKGINLQPFTQPERPRPTQTVDFNSVSAVERIGVNRGSKSDISTPQSNNNATSPADTVGSRCILVPCSETGFRAAFGSTLGPTLPAEAARKSNTPYRRAIQHDTRKQRKGEGPVLCRSFVSASRNLDSRRSFDI